MKKKRENETEQINSTRSVAHRRDFEKLSAVRDDEPTSFETIFLQGRVKFVVKDARAKTIERINVSLIQIGGSIG